MNCLHLTEDLDDWEIRDVLEQCVKVPKDGTTYYFLPGFEGKRAIVHVFVMEGNKLVEVSYPDEIRNLYELYLLIKDHRESYGWVSYESRIKMIKYLGYRDELEEWIEKYNEGLAHLKTLKEMKRPGELK